MNRTDRLYALAEELRFSGEAGRTSAQLAKQFEVTPRTIKRDITSLQQAGLPIWGEGGAGGGYRMLKANSALPAINFTPTEAAAVAVALHAHIDLPFAPEARTALTKLLMAMNPSERSATNELLDRVWVMPTGDRSKSARIIDEGIKQRKVVVISYADASGTETTREVEPFVLAKNGGLWYLVGWCLLREAGRTFRLDRIKSASLLNRSTTSEHYEEVMADRPEAAFPIQVAMGS